MTEPKTKTLYKPKSNIFSQKLRQGQRWTEPVTEALDELDMAWSAVDAALNASLSKDLKKALTYYQKAMVRVVPESADRSAAERCLRLALWAFEDKRNVLAAAEAYRAHWQARAAIIGCSPDASEVE